MRQHYMMKNLEQQKVHVYTFFTPFFNFPVFMQIF